MSDLRVLLPLFIFVVLFPAQSSAEILGASCDGDSIRISIGIYPNFGTMDGSVYRLEQQILGICVDPIIRPDVQIPVPYVPPAPIATYIHFEISRPQTPLPLRYQLLIQDPTGDIRPAFPQGDVASWDYVQCGAGAPFARGRLTRVPASPNDYLDFAPCENQCWPKVCLDEVDDAWFAFADQDVVVDVFGDPFVDLMLTTSCSWLFMRNATVAPSLSSDPCGPVATSYESWSALKARYR